MSDRTEEQVDRLSSRSNLTIKRFEGTVRPQVGRTQLVIWSNTNAGDIRLLFRGQSGILFEISGAYEVG